MQTKTFSLSDEASELLDKYKGNKSQYISDLITGELAYKDMPRFEFLQMKQGQIKKDMEVLTIELKDIERQIQEHSQKEKQYELKKKKEEKFLQFNLEGEELKRDWINGLIDDDEYWKKVDQRKKQREEMENEIE